MKCLLRLCIAGAAAFPGLASAYAYTAQDSNGGTYLKNQTVGLPVVWQQNQVTFNPRFDKDGIDYNGSVAAALAEWNEVGTRLQWQLGTTSVNPCENDGINVGGWREGVLCDGRSFGDALAVTSRNYQKINGLWYHVDTDVIVDATRNWQIYSGPLKQNSSGTANIYDFHRVILHELGHAAGLDHPDETTPPQDKPAIMNSKTSIIDTLQFDDKLGLVTIYAVSNDGNTNTSTNSGTTASSGGGGAWGWLLAPLCWRLHRARVHRRPRLA